MVLIIIIATVVAFFILFGIIGAKALKKERELIQKAEQGDAQAQFALGQIYKERNNFNDIFEAIKWFQKADEQSLNEAKPELENCKNKLETLIDKTTDKTKSIKDIEKAAEIGLVKAQIIIGDCLISGKGIEKNHEKAFYWFKRAIEQDLPEVHFRLAECYKFGRGTQIDLALAESHFKQAASRGHTGAKFELMKAIDFYNIGLKFMNENDFANACENFQEAYFKNMTTHEGVGYLAKFNCGIAAYNLGNYCGTHSRNVFPFITAWECWDQVYNEDPDQERSNKAKILMEKMYNEGKSYIKPSRYGQ